MTPSYQIFELNQAMTKKMINEFGTSKYIVNLGHGIYPDMSPDHVVNFIEAVHEVQIGNFQQISPL